MEAIKARMPWGLGRAMTMARDMSMAVHSSPDQCGSRVPGKTRQGSQRSILELGKQPRVVILAATCRDGGEKGAAGAGVGC